MKIGELFVDLGFNDGGALNKLTNFSIKFLALKNAAQQMGDVFDTMFGSVIDGVVEMENLNSTTGLSIERMNKWKAIAEQNNVAFGDVIASLKALQSASANIMLGKGNAAPFTQLGIDMSRPREAFALLNEIRGRIGQIKDVGLRRNLLQEMGISENMLILFERFNGYFDENIQLSQQERDEVMSLNREWMALKQTVGNAWDKVWAQAADGVSDYIKLMREAVTTTAELLSKSENLGDGLKSVFEGLANYLDEKFKDNYVLRGIFGLVNIMSEMVYSFGDLMGQGVAGANILVDQFVTASKRLSQTQQPNYLNPLWYMNTERGQQAVIQGATTAIGGNKTVNTNVTVNTSRPADGNMGQSLGAGISQQISNAGYLNG